MNVNDTAMSVPLPSRSIADGERRSFGHHDVAEREPFVSVKKKCDLSQPSRSDKDAPKANLFYTSQHLGFG
jgi:hypothetical protein